MKTKLEEKEILPKKKKKNQKTLKADSQMLSNSADTRKLNRNPRVEKAEVAPFPPDHRTLLHSFGLGRFTWHWK